MMLPVLLFHLIGNPTCYSHGFRSGHMGDSIMQEVERLVALGMLMKCFSHFKSS